MLPTVGVRMNWFAKEAKCLEQSNGLDIVLDVKEHTIVTVTLVV